MLKLNGVNLPAFVKVIDIKTMLLPPVENHFLQVRGRKIPYLLGKSTGLRKIEVEIKIIAESLDGVSVLVGELAEWLDHDGEATLQLEDNNRTYSVVYDGETEIDKLLNVGSGSLSFYCTHPYAAGNTYSEAFRPNENEVISVDIVSTAETFPIIDVTLSEAITDLSVTGEEGRVLIGTPADTDSTVTSGKPVILNDTMATLTGWATPSFTITGSTVAGNLKANEFNISPAAYGTGAAWHGPAAVKTLLKELQDFEVEVDLSLISNVKNMGKAQILLLDSSNREIGRISLSDIWNKYEAMRFEAKAGNQVFVNEDRMDGSWNSFNGIMRISRKGTKWTAFVGKRNTRGLFVSSFQNEWTDTAKLNTAKLGKVLIHFAGKELEPTPDTIFITNIKVFELVERAAGTVGTIAEPGDILTVDCERATILRNGEIFVKELNPVSTFFKFKKGTNTLSISPKVAGVTVTYTERWL